ncbi:hypothetical protein EGW08_019880, partial [Elysia chlorotica]
RGKLPNLKICVDNTESTDDSDVSVHDSGSYSSEEEYDAKFESSKKNVVLREREGPEDDVLSIGETEPTVRKFISRGNFQKHGPKIYENKSGNFVTGVDVTSEEAQEMRDKRAQRFGTLSNPKHPITDVDIKNLYRSLGLSVDKLAEDPRGWRLEAILLRGTENMSTEDVFKYFSDFGPKGVEWIDDFSCNVLWADKLTPARALLRLSSTMDEVHLAEKIVDNEMEGQEEATQKKDEMMVQETVPVSAPDKISEDPPSNPQAQSGGRDSVVQEESSPKDKTDTAVPAVLAGDELDMELDFDDDNIDLIGDDPIDRAMSTWSNFTQDKEKRAQRRASDAAAAKSRHDEEISKNRDVIAGAKEKGELEAMSSAGEKQLKESQKTSAKEKKASSVLEKDKDEARHNTAEEDNKMSGHTKVGKEKSSKTGGQVSKKKTMEVEDIDVKIKKEKGEKSKKSSEKPEKMEADGSDSDSSYTSSSSSSSSDSNSSSGSGSDSSSGSSSSSSSSSSSGNSSDGSKQKKLKSRSERNKERTSKKTVKKPEGPPVVPQVKEKSEIPWPPGFWRLGMPCAKAEFIFMRYAMKADKKLPGAEKKSEYYKKYGNPNFGGITGLISTSRKRRLRQQAHREVEEDPATVGESGPFGEEALPSNHRPRKSRLAGRLGVRERGKRAHSDDDEGTEDRNKLPSLREGKDLRDLLNGDPTAVKDELETNPDTEAAPAKDSDDEMDYSAELERLMGKDEDEGPPIKKRFMRMHADDEEAKIKTKKLTKTASAMHSPKWQKDKYEEERGLYLDDEDQEEEGEYEDEIHYPSFEERNPPISQKRRGYVDYDNVEDDDPFNLFGTAAPKETLPAGVYGSDEENDENGFEERYYGGRRGFTEADDRRGRGENSWKNSREAGGGLGGTVGGGGLDLRAKLQAKRRAGNRNW